MNRRMITAALVLLLSGSVFAVPSVYVDRTYGHYVATSKGGEFTVTPNAELSALTGADGPFYSFCLEYNENAVLYTDSIAYVNDEALTGGGRWAGEPAGPDGGDLISPETAFLYTEFSKGTLSGYNYTTPNRGVSAYYLQIAVWHLEQEGPYTDYASLPDASQDFVDLANGSDSETIGDVRVLNLFSPTGLFRQDILVMTQPIPAPGAIVLGGIGMGLVGWLRRRRSL